MAPRVLAIVRSNYTVRRVPPCPHLANTLLTRAWYFQRTSADVSGLLHRVVAGQRDRADVCGRWWTRRIELVNRWLGVRVPPPALNTL